MFNYNYFSLKNLVLLRKKKMSIFSFGEYKGGFSYKVLDEREVRASAGIMLFFALVAFVNVGFLERYYVITIVSGGLMLNFMIGLFINPKFAPTMILAKILVSGQSALPIGAIQKKFAWSLGLILSSTIFGLSLLLLNNINYFETVCILCVICLWILYFETAFGICLGCQIYHYALKLKIIPQPKEKPNCMGDSCEV